MFLEAAEIWKEVRCRKGWEIKRKRGIIFWGGVTDGTKIDELYRRGF